MTAPHPLNPHTHRLSKMMLDDISRAIALARNQCLKIQRDDGSWRGEVFSNASFTTQYVFLCHQLGISISPQDHEAIVHWLLSQQNDDGSWGMGPGCSGDVSTTTETYLALKILDVSTTDSRMLAARGVIVGLGGLPACRMFTRVFLASFGLIPWSALPVLPPELILLPTMVPINIYHMASWARATCVPLLLIRHHEPIYALPNGLGPVSQNPFLDELWSPNIKRDFSYSRAWELCQKWDAVGLFFQLGDKVLSLLGRHLHSPCRSYARRKVLEWILQHQEVSGEWAGYWPPQHNNIWALSLEGFTLEHPVMHKAINAMESFIYRDKGGMRIQVTVSQVWDTVLMSIALSDSALDACVVKSLTKASDWILEREVKSEKGDWKILKPHLAPGGWCFEEFNTLYPDVDDSCAVLLALLKAGPAHLSSDPVRRAIKWIIGMQNRDGGWGAFDSENDYSFLNKIPFSDMDSMCDPSTPDVSGRILECWGLILQHESHLKHSPHLLAEIKASAARVLCYLLREQKPEGPWYGRWGVNYIYGASNVLNGLRYFYDGGDKTIESAIYRAVKWIQSRQNSDGGWGELSDSYGNASLAGIGPSTAAQTAWGLMALMPYLPAENANLTAGIKWLVDKQISLDETRSTWPLAGPYTATGFPGHLCLEYDQYRHYFPMMALGRYVAKVRSAEKASSVGFYFTSSYKRV